MTEKTISARQKQKGDTSANWASSQLVLLEGEFAYATDTKVLKMGDGMKTWSQLPEIYNPTNIELLWVATVANNASIPNAQTIANYEVGSVIGVLEPNQWVYTGIEWTDIDTNPSGKAYAAGTVVHKTSDDTYWAYEGNLVWRNLSVNYPGFLEYKQGSAAAYVVVENNGTKSLQPLTNPTHLDSKTLPRVAKYDTTDESAYAIRGYASILRDATTGYQHLNETVAINASELIPSNMSSLVGQDKLVASSALLKAQYQATTETTITQEIASNTAYYLYWATLESSEIAYVTILVNDGVNDTEYQALYKCSNDKAIHSYILMANDSTALTIQPLQETGLTYLKILNPTTGTVTIKAIVRILGDVGAIESNTVVKNVAIIDTLDTTGMADFVDLSKTIAKACSTMNTPKVDQLGTIVQYIGATDANYTNGYYYKVVAKGTVPETYDWQRIDVQPGTDPLPAHTSADSGKVLSVNSLNNLEWKTITANRLAPDYSNKVEIATSPVTVTNDCWLIVDGKVFSSSTCPYQYDGTTPSQYRVAKDEILTLVSTTTTGKAYLVPDIN